MTETLDNLIQRLAENLNSACITFAVLKGYLHGSSPNEESQIIGVSEFTEKEIMKMPKSFRKEFRTNGCTAHIRKRSSGRYKCSYEIRYNRNGNNISVSATTLEEAKQRFIDKLNNITVTNENYLNKTPNKFCDFSLYWFENFHQRKVCTAHYKHNLNVFDNHIKDKIKNVHLSNITPILLQELLDSLNNKHRIQEDVYCLLNQIFKCAVNHGLIKLNPIAMCFHKSAERTHGTLISKSNEMKLLNYYRGKPEQILFAVSLYCGLRPGELATAIIDGHFIEAVNLKRKNGKNAKKRIPINPMLAPYLVGVSELPKMIPQTLDRRLKAVLPNHKLYDMRTTFQTRCSECGIPDNVIGVFMGNSIGKLKDAYTDFSDEYLFKQGEKFDY